MCFRCGVSFHVGSLTNITRKKKTKERAYISMTLLHKPKQKANRSMHNYYLLSLDGNGHNNNDTNKVLITAHHVNYYLVHVMYTPYIHVSLRHDMPCMPVSYIHNASFYRATITTRILIDVTAVCTPFSTILKFSCLQ